MADLRAYRHSNSLRSPCVAFALVVGFFTHNIVQMYQKG